MMLHDFWGKVEFGSTYLSQISQPSLKRRLQCKCTTCRNTETHQKALGDSHGAEQWCHSGRELLEIRPTERWTCSPLGLQPPTLEREGEWGRHSCSLCLERIWMASVCEASKRFSHWAEQAKLACLHGLAHDDRVLLWRSYKQNIGIIMNLSFLSFFREEQLCTANYKKKLKNIIRTYHFWGVHWQAKDKIIVRKHWKSSWIIV